MDNFIRGLLTVLLWFFTLGGMFCALIISGIGTIIDAPWTWYAIFPFGIFIIGETIALVFKLKVEDGF